MTAAIRNVLSWKIASNRLLMPYNRLSCGGCVLYFRSNKEYIHISFQKFKFVNFLLNTRPKYRDLNIISASLLICAFVSKYLFEILVRVF